MPLALGIGEGADAQSPLARAVIGGLAGSTLITLGLIPAFLFLLFLELRDHLFDFFITLFIEFLFIRFQFPK